MRPISKIITHCSATPDVMDIGFEEINGWHLQRDFKSPTGVGCGYHFVIRKNGVIEVGRMVDEVGAHVSGENEFSIGVCVVGTHEFNQAQIHSLRRVVDGLLGQYPTAKVYGHREFPSAKAKGKTCPNMDVHQVLSI